MLSLRSVRTCVLVLVASIALPSAAQAQGTTALVFDSQPGDYIGAGDQHTYTEADAPFVVRRNFDNGVSVSLRPDGFAFWWDLDFAAAGNTPLQVGTYNAARRFPFQVFNGLDVGGSGRGCNALAGRYEVLEIEYAGSEVTRLAIDFEQHCEGATPALFGVLRYHSTISNLTPFGGDYPRFRLTVTPPAHGTITGGGLDCGNAGTTCVIDLASASSVSVTATPDPGYLFAGWSEDCLGVATGSVRRDRRARVHPRRVERRLPRRP